jgi:hypothetical protein
MLKEFCIICVLWIPTVFADCISCSDTVVLDTLRPGEVVATECVMHCYGPQDTCMKDTFSESGLIDSLRYGYGHNIYVIFGHVDSVARIMDTIWQEDLTHESVYVVIDNNLKGNWPETGLRFEYGGICANSFTSLLNREFLLFFNDINAVSTLAGSNIGIHPGYFVGEEIGYFIIDGKIVRKGLNLWLNYGMPGVAVDSAYFINEIVAAEKKRPPKDIDKADIVICPNPVSPATRIYLQLTKAAHVRLEVFDMEGRKLHVLDDAYRAAGLYNVKWNPVGFGSMIYFIKLTTLNSVTVVKAINMR